MVIMDQNTNISGSPTSSQVLSNGIHSISNGISNGIQSIQSLPPQVYILKERIVNKSYHYMNDGNGNSSNSGMESDMVVGMKDYGEGGVYYFEDENNRSASPSRLRSLSAPASGTGTKNQRELFQQSIDSLAAKFNNSGSGSGSTRSCGSSASPLKNSGGSTNESDSDKANIKIPGGDQDSYYCDSNCEELSNIDEEIKKMRSFSLTSFENTLKRNHFSPAGDMLGSSREDDVLSPYEMISHLEYQERIEREEMERLDKNNVIISQSTCDGYTGNQVQYPTITNNIISSSSNNICIPKISVSSSNSFTGYPPHHQKNTSPPKHNSSNSLTGSLNGTNHLNNNNSGHTTPIVNNNNNILNNSSNSSFSSATNSFNSSPNRSSPLFKRSLTANTPLSKSASKLPTTTPTLLVVQPPTIIENEHSPEKQPKKVQPLVKSSSQHVLREQQFQQLQQRVRGNQSPSPSSLSPNRPSTPVQMHSSPNLNPLKKLSNKLSLSTHSLPSSNSINNSNNTTPLPSSPLPINKHLTKCPSGNSISINRKLTNSPIPTNQQPQINNLFQMELKQRLEKKQDTGLNNSSNSCNNSSGSTGSSNNNVGETRKDRFENKRSNIPKPMDEPTSLASSSCCKITFQFTCSGKKVNRLFNIDCKVEEIKNYIEWLAYQEPQLFDSSFKQSDDSIYKIVDYNISYTQLPTKFQISNFEVTFKDSGFTPKSNLINISLV